MCLFTWTPSLQDIVGLYKSIWLCTLFFSVRKNYPLFLRNLLWRPEGIFWTKDKENFTVPFPFFKLFIYLARKRSPSRGYFIVRDIVILIFEKKIFLLLFKRISPFFQRQESMKNVCTSAKVGKIFLPSPGLAMASLIFLKNVLLL